VHDSYGVRALRVRLGDDEFTPMVRLKVHGTQHERTCNPRFLHSIFFSFFLLLCLPVWYCSASKRDSRESCATITLLPPLWVYQNHFLRISETGCHKVIIIDLTSGIVSPLPYTKLSFPNLSYRIQTHQYHHSLCTLTLRPLHESNSTALRPRRKALTEGTSLGLCLFPWTEVASVHVIFPFTFLNPWYYRSSQACRTIAWFHGLT